MESLFDLLWGKNPIDPNEGTIEPQILPSCTSSSIMALCGDGHSPGGPGGPPPGSGSSSSMT